MADEPYRVVRTVQVKQHVEVSDVVRKPVALDATRGLAEAAPVGRDDEPVSCQRVDKELERRTSIVPAVQQDQ